MSATETGVRPVPDEVVVRRRPWSGAGRWAGGGAVVLLAAMLTHTLATNPRFEWDVVGGHLFDETILLGVWRTIQLTMVSMAIGLVLGTVLAVMRMSPNPLLAGAAWSYVWFFRATPLLVQLLFWYNLAALYPDLSLGIPFGPDLVSVPSERLVNAFTAAILGLALHQAAYTAEIVRAGILAVDPGQREAATALGMSRMLALRRVILPQAMRAIVPPVGNEFVSMLKTTSLVSIIALPELLYSAQIIYARTYQTIPLLLVATMWYLALTAALSAAQHYIESHYGRGYGRSR